jgi:hypothetical protein
MKNKDFNTVFGVIFVLLLLIPLLLTDLRNGLVAPEENRMLADRPPLSSMNHPQTFIRNFTEWFNDHIGLRGKFISLYKFLGKSQKQGPQYREGDVTYIIGRGGHHFFTGSNNHDMIGKFAGNPVFSSEELQTFSHKLTSMQDYLNKRDIPLIVMFCADKETIYPEYYSPAVKRGPEPVQLDLITSYLKNNTSVDIFNVRQALLEQKDRYLLFPKGPPGDLTHYNEIGAFFAYRELMCHINTYYPDIIPYSLDDIDIDCDENGVARVNLKENPEYTKYDDSFFDNVTTNSSDGWANRAFESTARNSPAILILRDSYMGDENSFILKYIARHFSKTIAIHFLNMNNLEQYIDAFNPDIMVLETAERQIPGFFASVNGLNL